HDAEDVHGHDAIEVGEVVVEEPLVRGADARVVTHDVEAAEARHRGVDGGLHLLGVGDVDRLENGRVAQLLGEGGAAVGVHVGDDNVRALLDEPLDHPAAEPARTAGHDRDLAVEITHGYEISSIQKSGVVSILYLSKIASISARSASLIDQPIAPALSST